MSLGWRRFLLYGLALGVLYVVLDAGPFLYVVSSPASQNVRLGRTMFIAFFPLMGLQCGLAWLIAHKCRPQWQWGIMGFVMKLWLMGTAAVVAAVVVRGDPGGTAAGFIFATAWELQQGFYVWLAAYLGFYPFRRAVPGSTA